jgi:hypothetical protein
MPLPGIFEGLGVQGGGLASIFNVNLSRKSSCLPNALLLLIQCLIKPIAAKLSRLHSSGASG